MSERGSVARGLALMAVASCCFALMAACAKQAHAVLSYWETTFWRSVITCLIASAVLYVRPAVTSEGRHWLWLRGIFGTAGLVCYFFALSRIPLAKAMLLNNTAPVFTTVMAVAFLGERLSAGRAFSLALALSGVWLVLRPTGGDVGLGVWLALISAVFAAMVHVIIKRLSQGHNPWQVVWYFSAVGILVGLPGTLAGFHPLQGWLIVTVIGMGLAATMAQITMTSAYRHLSASAASTAGLLTVLAGVLLGWVWFDEVPATWTFIGGGLILAGGLGASLPEAMARRRQRRQLTQTP